MGNKIAFVGLGLSELGLGHFFPALIPAGAIIFVVGIIAIVLDR